MAETARYAVRPRETVSMTTRDGVRLDAYIYRPDADGPFPVLLMRQPYGRAIASTITYAHPLWYAAHGYIVVIQDVRGRGTSEGDFRVFEQEVDDGADAVAWAASLPGSTGDVGMYGFSYQGMTQLFAASARPPALKTICPAMYAWDVYRDFAYEGGAFHLALSVEWGLQLATETLRRAGDVDGHQAVFAASRALPLHDAVPARPALLDRYAEATHYRDWVDNPDPGPYWDSISPAPRMAAVDLPVLHIGGWYDFMLDGTLTAYREMAARCASPQKLVVGPWMHAPWGMRQGDTEFGPSAASPAEELQIRWFDHWLKGVDTGFLDEPPVSLYEMGGERWRAFDAWPSGDGVSFYLQSGGRASADVTDGQLTKDPAPDRTVDPVVHDPWRPVPAHGGHAAFPGGMCDRGAVDSRADVLTYTSEPLDADLHLAGEVTLELWCHADRPSFDVSAVLSRVGPDGRPFNITQGHLRLVDGDVTNPVTVSLRATCCRVAAGERLRLSIAGACFPACDVNPGTGARTGEARLIDQQTTTIFVDSGAATPSRLRIAVQN